MTEPDRPVNQWATKKELIRGTFIALVIGFLSLFGAIFLNAGPVSVVATAMFFFLAGVGAAPLFYKTWFKRSD